MTFLRKLFGKRETIYDKVITLTEPLIIKTYRDLAKSKNCAPTSKTSDSEILNIYKIVMTEFKNVSRQKGDELPAIKVNYIVFYFLNIYEQNGKDFFEEHLKYEIMKFQVSGLRESYKNKEIKFF
jgi:hypothetical protein